MVERKADTGFRVASREAARRRVATRGDDARVDEAAGERRCSWTDDCWRPAAAVDEESWKILGNYRRRKMSAVDRNAVGTAAIVIAGRVARSAPRAAVAGEAGVAADPAPCSLMWRRRFSHRRFYRR